ncbi:MAG: hypothetical protein IJP32_10985, partial [Clostridia bacterium]|nr:hypothetical protein [Clostridia bacterium]
MWKRKEAKWKRLDNAAKIFPALAGQEDSEVFRIACALHEDVDPEILQAAVDAASPGETILIRPGLYRERVVLYRPGLHLVGEDPETT